MQTSPVFPVLLLVTTLSVPCRGADAASELAPPLRIEAGEKPIDTDIGHAHPLFVDWDGDGDRDLLVGQFGSGILWIFENAGTAAAPRLAAGVKFKDGQKDGRVPTG